MSLSHEAIAWDPAFPSVEQRSPAAVLSTSNIRTPHFANVVASDDSRSLFDNSQAHEQQGHQQPSYSDLGFEALFDSGLQSTLFKKTWLLLVVL